MIPSTGLHRRDTIRNDRVDAQSALHRAGSDATIRALGRPDESQNGGNDCVEREIDESIFEFPEFNLDLTCLSRPTSPAPSTSHFPPPSPPPTPSPPPSPLLLRAKSFMSSAASSSGAEHKPLRSQASQQLPVAAAKRSNPRGSWPLLKYTGRGTPIDRIRRIEWAGLTGNKTSSDVGATEDGRLISATSPTMRSASLDSARRPSVSPQWSYLSPRAASSLADSTEADVNGSAHARDDIKSPTRHCRQVSSSSMDEPAPALAPIESLSERDGDNWATELVQTVLGSTAAQPASSPTSLCRAPSPSPPPPDDPLPNPFDPTHPPPRPETALAIDLSRSIDTALDLGQVGTALDLGLGRHGGMDLFSLGLVSAPGQGGSEHGFGSGRASPAPSGSVYSQDVVVVATPGTATVASGSSPLAARTFILSTSTSTKAEPDVGRGGGNASVGVNLKTDAGRLAWWRRLLHKLQRLNRALQGHSASYKTSTQF